MNIKKIVAVGSIMTLAIPMAVFADDSGSLSYNGIKAKAKLTTKWSSGYDKAKARTDFTTSNGGYKVTAYGEVERYGDVLDSGFDSGNVWAEVNVSGQDASSLNSSHSIANANNVYDYVDLERLSES